MTIIKRSAIIESEREVTAMMYEYTKNKKIKWYKTRIDNNKKFPYTYNEKQNAGITEAVSCRGKESIS